jgi:predicted O-methyltransferase YrrM
VIDAKARAVMSRLERQDAGERGRGTAREVRLRQIGPEVGRFLHTLVLARRPRMVVEVGTSGGYSTIWLATAARAGGRHRRRWSSIREGAACTGTSATPASTTS